MWCRVCSSVEVHWRYGWTYYLRLHGWRVRQARNQPDASGKRSELRTVNVDLSSYEFPPDQYHILVLCMRFAMLEVCFYFIFIFIAGFLLELLFDPKNWNNTFFRNVGELPNYAELHPRWQYSSYSHIVCIVVHLITLSVTHNIQCIASDDRPMNSELKNMWKETAVAQLLMLFQYLSGGTDDNHERFQSERSVPRPRFKAVASQEQFRRLTCANMLGNYYVIYLHTDVF
jgi:hypothetical protein